MITDPAQETVPGIFLLRTDLSLSAFAAKLGFANRWIILNNLSKFIKINFLFD